MPGLIQRRTGCGAGENDRRAVAGRQRVGRVGHIVQQRGGEGRTADQRGVRGEGAGNGEKVGGVQGIHHRDPPSEFALAGQGSPDCVDPGTDRPVRDESGRAVGLLGQQPEIARLVARCRATQQSLSAKDVALVDGKFDIGPGRARDGEPGAERCDQGVDERADRAGAVGRVRGQNVRAAGLRQAGDGRRDSGRVGKQHRHAAVGWGLVERERGSDASFGQRH